MEDEGFALPLAGLRVLDVGSRIAAPFCAGLLGEQGAEVIKIEQPGTGEYLRVLSPLADGYSLMWAVEGRHRRSVTLDLRTKRGQDLFRRLAAHCDVVCENFRPGTMERWHLGPEDLADHLVYVRISTFGQTGPDRAKPGVDLIGLAFSGVLDLTGHADEEPVKSAVTVSDHLTGVHAATAAVAALLAGRRHGGRRGAVVDASLCGSLVRTLDWRIPAAAAGHAPTRRGNGDLHPGHHGVHPSADGSFVAVAAACGDATEALGRLVGPGDGGDLGDALAAWTAARTASEAAGALVAAGVPAAVVRDAAGLSHGVGGLIEVDDPVLGPVLQQAPVPAWRGARQDVTPAPLLGADNDDVWCGLVGLAREELDDLRASGVV